MNTSFATSIDGHRIAFDVSGSGEPIILLHGGGRDRRDWHAAGYVERLKRNFQVITIDIRGNGESDRPSDATCYTTDRHCQDILAVADAVGVARFAVWGFSYGANIGRYLASQSTRVTKFVMVGIPFGPAAPGEFGQFIGDLRDYWAPILQARADGTLDLQSLSPEDQSRLQSGEITLRLAWLTAMLGWRPVEPGDLLCPTLWLVGTRNAPALASTEEYRPLLDKTKVRVQILEGLNHRQEFTEIDQMLPTVLAFAQP
jgi:pimeloyl-ACP methyl ester carboxylesterase